MPGRRFIRVCGEHLRAVDQGLVKLYGGVLNLTQVKRAAYDKECQLCSIDRRFWKVQRG